MSDVVDLFPPGARVDGDGELVVGGCRLRDLAAELGTPAYVVDEVALRERAREYRDELRARWPDALAIFASKAFPCTAVLGAVAEEGLGCDVAGAGELVHALAAGVDPARIYLHGNAKTDEDLRQAIDAGVGTVVVDNLDDVDRLERLVSGEQAVLVRVIPGVRPDTHAAVATGQEDSKFGLAPADARTAIERLRGSDRLRLDGLHVHIGSQILDAEPFGRAAEALGAFGEFAVYDLGGGLGARYTYADRPPSVAEYLDVIVGAAHEHLPASARLVIEPGRSLVARAGVTLYRVVTVKRGGRTFVAVDGGMGDNLEVSLYGQRFEATVADRVGGGQPVTSSGATASRATCCRPAWRCASRGWATSSPCRSRAPTASRCATATTARCARRLSSCATAMRGSWCGGRTTTTCCVLTCRRVVGSSAWRLWRFAAQTASSREGSVRRSRRRRLRASACLGTTRACFATPSQSALLNCPDLYGQEAYKSGQREWAAVEGVAKRARTAQNLHRPRSRNGRDRR